MHVVVFTPSDNEVVFSREMEANETMHARTFAEIVGRMYGVGIDESNGYIPSSCGDLRVEFRPDPDNECIIWSGESFYFEQ